MKQCNIKTRDNQYLVSESDTLVITSSNSKKAMIIYSIKNAKEYIKRLENEKHMKKYLPLKIEIIKENKQVNFEDLQVGDIVNYDIQLISGNVKNETSLVIEKTSEYVKLNNWLVTKDYFNTLKNVTIIEDVKKSLKSN